MNPNEPETFIPDNLSRTPRHSHMEHENSPWPAIILVVIVVALVPVTFSIYLDYRAANEIIQSYVPDATPAEREARLAPILARIKDESDRLQREHERNLERIKHGVSLQQIQREKEGARQKQMADVLSAIRLELERRK